jgi:hypothetical protein
MLGRLSSNLPINRVSHRSFQDTLLIAGLTYKEPQLEEPAAQMNVGHPAHESPQLQLSTSPGLIIADDLG